MDRIKAIERAWIRDRALSGEILDDVVRSTYSYALRLASSCALPVQRTHGAIEYVDITPHTNELRSELESIMSSIGSAVTYPVTPKALSGIGILAPCGKWHRATLVAHYPAVAKHLRTAIGRLFRAYPCIDESSIERELRQKALVLALGGGGGTGYAHICLFRWLEECGIAPELITGTSFGAIAGYLRSLQTNYDAAMTMLKLPGYWKFIRNLHPCIGTGTHGLMGICRIDFDALCEILWRSAGYSRPPAFGELKIPFAAVATGILATSHLAAEIEPKTPLRSLSGVLRLTQLSWRKAMHHAAQIANLIVKQGDGVEPSSSASTTKRAPCAPSTASPSRHSSPASSTPKFPHPTRAPAPSSTISSIAAPSTDSPTADSPATSPHAPHTTKSKTAASERATHGSSASTSSLHKPATASSTHSNKSPTTTSAPTHDSPTPSSASKTSSAPWSSHPRCRACTGSTTNSAKHSTPK